MQTPTPEIRQAFYKSLLEALPYLGLDKGDVAWPNTVYRPSPERLYLRPFCLFNETALASLSETGFERLSGIFQISVFGVLNTGEGAMEETARQLVDHFRCGKVLPVPCFNSLVIEKAWRGSLQIAAGSIQGGATRPMIPVSVRWRQFTPRGD